MTIAYMVVNKHGKPVIAGSHLLIFTRRLEAKIRAIEASEERVIRVKVERTLLTKR